MNPSKPWYASAGVWGALVTLAGSVLALLKLEVDPALLEDIRQWVLSLATLVGGAVALWGRLRASRRIGPAGAGGGVGGSAEGTGAGGGVGGNADGADGAGTAGAAPTGGTPVGRRMLVLLIGAALPLGAAPGCAALNAPAGPYVAADRATYDAVAPEYEAYIARDPALSPEQRQRRSRTLALWRLRLDDAERRVVPGRQAAPRQTTAHGAMNRRSDPAGDGAHPGAPHGSQASRLNGDVPGAPRFPHAPITTPTPNPDSRTLNAEP